MKCDCCNVSYKDIIRHLKNSKNCQSSYDMESLIRDRKLARVEKKRSYMKKFYQDNKEEKKKYYESNKKSIREKQAVSYRNSKSRICQRQRFYKTFSNRRIYIEMSFITQQQKHLYYHTQGFCQPETMPDLNHSVEFYDGLCVSCNKLCAIKLIDVNRLVCLQCEKAYCNLCKCEVSPNPFLGYLHFSPDRGHLLGFLPGYCPLYSGTQNEKKDCKMCVEIKYSYPEYELFIGT